MAGVSHKKWEIRTEILRRESHGELEAEIRIIIHKPKNVKTCQHPPKFGEGHGIDFHPNFWKEQTLLAS